MQLLKSIEYFDPASVNVRCHVIGCGSVGSSVAELLARLGLRKISLYDFDTVSAHNIANQMFFDSDIKRLKTEAVRDMIVNINPEAKPFVEIFSEGWTDKIRLGGYVFLCVDNIDLRREICEKNKMNHAIKGVFDWRTRLEEVQCFAADWSNPKQVKNLIATMDFSHDEAKDATPRTACGVEIGVAPTIRLGTAYGIANFLNFVKGKGLKPMIVADAFNFNTITI